jgi:hypothetical protein
MQLHSNTDSPCCSMLATSQRTFMQPVRFDGFSPVALYLNASSNSCNCLPHRADIQNERNSGLLAPNMSYPCRIWGSLHPHKRPFLSILSGWSRVPHYSKHDTVYIRNHCTTHFLPDCHDLSTEYVGLQNYSIAPISFNLILIRVGRSRGRPTRPEPQTNQFGLSPLRTYASQTTTSEDHSTSARVDKGKSKDKETKLPDSNLGVVTDARKHGDPGCLGP